MTANENGQEMQKDESGVNREEKGIQVDERTLGE